MRVFQPCCWNLTVFSTLEPSQRQSIFSIFFSSSPTHIALHPSLHLLYFYPQPRPGPVSSSDQDGICYLSPAYDTPIDMHTKTNKRCFNNWTQIITPQNYNTKTATNTQVNIYIFLHYVAITCCYTHTNKNKTQTDLCLNLKIVVKWFVLHATFWQ